MKISVNKLAPDFTLNDQNGKPQSLSDFKGNWVLLYFYPRDNTPGCTKEACSMRDNWKAFDKLDTQVIGVSTDSVSSHAKFSEKYKLNFPILSDEDKIISKQYNVWKKKKIMGKEYMGIVRTSFLIDPEGKIEKIYEKVKPTSHASDVIEDINELIA